MIPVEHYGLHLDGAIPWLLQGRGGTNFLGLKKTCPFVMKGDMCNHLIPAQAPIPDRIHWEVFQKLAKDPLVQIMLPIPRAPEDRAFFLEDPYDDLNLYISCLSRFSSPIRGVMKPAWMVKNEEMEYQMGRTNIQPWIVTQATQKQQPLITRISKSSPYLPRTTLVTGNSEVVVSAPMKRINTDIRSFDLQTLISLPIENIGATVLRRFSRKEKIDGDIESRQDRRDRMIRERTSK